MRKCGGGRRVPWDSGARADGRGRGSGTGRRGRGRGRRRSTHQRRHAYLCQLARSSTCRLAGISLGDEPGNLKSPVLNAVRSVRGEDRKTLAPYLFFRTPTCELATGSPANTPASSTTYTL